MTQFKKILLNHNIKLFDHEYRISYFKIKLLNTDNQIGGGSTYNKIILNNKNKKDLENIINYSLSYNLNLGYLYKLIYN